MGRRLTVLLLGSLMASLVLAMAGVAWGAEKGRNDPPPPGSECTIEGTNRSEVLRGTDRSDVICGFGGDDILIGEKGRDLLRGGAGDDALDTEDFVFGNDTANGGRGNDACNTDRRDERISC